MYKVKLTISPYDSGIERQLPKSGTVWNNYQFFINEEIEEADFWVVLFRSFGPNKQETCKVAPENTIFITQEPDSVYQYSQGFLNQFGLVVSCQEKLKHKNVVKDLPANAWWIGKIIDGPGKIRYTHRYDDMLTSVPEKKKLMSVICSNKAFTKGHRDRNEFVRVLKEHYGDQLDLFGHGYNDFDDKWDVVADYKYHICIENCQQPYYCTEKLSDVFLANTFPLYYGAPNAGDFYNKDSFRAIDIHDPQGAIKIIDEGIANDLATKNADAVQESKLKVLNEYNLFNLIAKYCDQMNAEATKKNVTMKDDLTFFDMKKARIVMNRIISNLKFKLFKK